MKARKRSDSGEMERREVREGAFDVKVVACWRYESSRA
jgi:hypothetical protein